MAPFSSSGLNFMPKSLLIRERAVKQESSKCCDCEHKTENGFGIQSFFVVGSSLLILATHCFNKSLSFGNRWNDIPEPFVEYVVHPGAAHSFGIAEDVH